VPCSVLAGTEGTWAFRMGLWQRSQRAGSAGVGPTRDMSASGQQDIAGDTIPLGATALDVRSGKYGNGPFDGTVIHPELEAHRRRLGV
jgi:hypothetical protein